MTLGVKCVNDEERLAKKLRLSQHAIRLQGTRKVINDHLRGLLPTGIDCRKNVIPALCVWDAMEAVTDAMWTPHAHQATR